MQEVFSKTVDPNVPLSEQDFYELCLDDSDNIWRGRHVIRERHAHWDDSLGMVVWCEPMVEYLRTLEDARQRYEIRRTALAAKGYVFSDMDW
jgi:hypothetical protein